MISPTADDLAPRRDSSVSIELELSPSPAPSPSPSLSPSLLLFSLSLSSLSLSTTRLPLDPMCSCWTRSWCRLPGLASLDRSRRLVGDRRGLRRRPDVCSLFFSSLSLLRSSLLLFRSFTRLPLTLGPFASTMRVWAAVEAAVLAGIGYRV